MGEAGGDKLRRKTFGERMKKLPTFVLFGLVLFFLMAGILSKKAIAASAPSIITYQGKLLIGSRLATTTQDIYYLLYDASSGGNILYTASGTIAVPQAISTTPSQGLFSINLGDTGTNSLSPSIFQNNGSVYLEVRVGADTLTPRKRITASPYAFNSKYLDGVGINTVSSSTYIPVSDAIGNFNFNSTTIITSTISNLTAGSATTTNIFATTSAFVNSTISNVTSTNLYISSLSNFAGLLTFSTASGTAITSTNAFFSFVSSTYATSTNLVVTGSLSLPANSITDAMVIDTITASNYLLLSGGTLTGPLFFVSASGTAITSTNAIFVSATSTNLYVSGALSLPNDSVTDAMVANNITASNYLLLTGGTLSGPLTFATASGTAITSTNAIFENASTTNLYVSGVTNFGNTTVSNLTATSITSTNLYISSLSNFAGLLTFSMASGTAITSTNAIFVSATTTNLFATSSVFVNATSTNLYISSLSNFAGLLTFSTATGTSITSTNAFFTNLSATNFNPTNITAVSITSTNLFATSSVFVNVTSTNLFATSSVFNTTTINNRLGVGTSTPSQALSVVGNISNLIDPSSAISVVSTTVPGGGSILGLFVSNNYLYTASNVGKLSIIDVSVPSSPVVVGSTTILTNPQDVIVAGHYAYVSHGTNNIFSVVDISSANAPQVIATTTLGGYPIAVSGRYIYGVNATVSQLRVLDVSNPFAPNQIASISTSGNTPSDIFVYGTYAYITHRSNSNFSIFDISNPALPKLVSATSISAAEGVFVSGRYAYLATGSNNSVAVVDISNPAAPSLVTTTSMLNNPFDIVVAGRYAYVVNKTSNTVAVVDVSVPGSPFEITRVTVGSTPGRLVLSGRYVYTANQGGSGGVSIIDIGGTEVSSLIAHSANIGALHVRNDIFIQGNIIGGTSLMVGAGGISSQGGLSVFSSSTGATTSLFLVGSKNSSTTLQVFADGTIVMGTTTVSGLFTFTNASGTSITSTNAFFTFVSSTSATSTNLYISSLANFAGALNFATASGTTLTSTNFFFTTATGTSITSTNAFFSGLNFVNATGTSITSTNAFFSGLNFINATGTSLTSTNGFFSNFNFINASGTMVSTTNLYVANRIGINTSSPIASLSIQGIGGTNPLSILSSTGAQLFAIKTDGQVVVGPNSLSQAGQLTIETPTTNDIALSFTNGVHYTFQLGRVAGSSGQAFIGGPNGTALNLRAGGTDRVNINATTGFVGINSTSAIAQLSIKGTGTGDLFAITSSTNASMFTILTNGNVGVGTSTPTQKLSVSGNISNIIDSNTAISQIATTSVDTGPQSIFVSGRYAYVANYVAQSFSIVDISDPSTPVKISTTTVPGQPNAIFVSGRYAYIGGGLGGAANFFRVFDISDPAMPVLVSSASPGVQAKSIYVSGRYAYVVGFDALNNNVFSILDFANPISPVTVLASTNMLPSGTMPISVYVSGRYAYTANSGSNDISVIDISSPSLPILVASTSVGGMPSSIYVSGRYAYVANATTSNMSIVDISSSTHPVQVATAAVGTSPQSVFVSGRYAYVANSSSASISIVDVLKPNAPAQVATVSVGTRPYSVYVSGRYAYVANKVSDSISVVDISGTEVSSLIAHSAEVGNIQSRNDIFAQGNIMAGTSLTVGAGGIMSQGALSVFASSTGSTSSIFSIASPQVSNILKAFANGSVSIGVSSAAASLTVQGVAGSIPVLNINSSTGGNLLTVNTNGNVGINSSSPIAQLSIQGTGTGNPVAITSSTGDPVFTVLTNGNVGINTGTPTQKFSVSGNISNIIDANSGISQIATTSVGTGPQSIFVSGRYAYVANFDSSNITIIDISDPSNPVRISTTSFNANPRSIFVSGRYMYVVGQSGGAASKFSIFDISDPAMPALTYSLGGAQIARSVYVSGHYAYMAAYNSSNLYVFDVSNPQAPVQTVTLPIDTNPASVYVSGRYAYTANAGANTISVIDISNPDNPAQIATTSVGGMPSSIYVSGRYAYVANATSSDISVIDISSSTHPVQVATASLGGSPYSIYVSGRYAYVANTTTASISIVDVLKPNAPAQVATVSVGTRPYSVYVSGRYAYVANQGSDSISVVDISGTEVSSLIAHSAEVGNIQSRNDIFAQGNIMAGTSLTVGAGGIMSQGALSVFASSTGSTSSIFSIASPQVSNILKAFANGSVSIGVSSAAASLTVQGVAGSIPVLNINSSTGGNLLTVNANGNVGINSSSPSQKLTVSGNIANIIDSGTTISQIATTSVEYGPNSIFVSGRYAYVTNYLSSTFSVVDISKPYAPVQIATTTAPGSPLSVFVSGRYAYVVGIDFSSFTVIDISNPSTPTRVNTSGGGTFTSFYVSGRYAYTVDRSANTFSILDISDPSSLNIISTISVGTSPSAVYVSGRYAYVANKGSNNISVIDVSDPFVPAQIGTKGVGNGPSSIYVSGRYAYTANASANNISIVDVSNPLNLSEVATVAVGTGPNSIFVSGRYAYVTNSTSASVSVVDVYSPTAPVQVATVAVGNGPNSIFVSGRYAYTANYSSNTISVVDISGTEVSSLIAHSAEVGNIQSRNDIFAQGNIMAGTSLTVGAGGIMSQGVFSIFSSTTKATTSVFSVSSVASSSIFSILASGRIGINSSSPIYNFVSKGSAALPGIGTSAVGGDLVCYITGDGKIYHQAANCNVSSARFKENILSLSKEELMAKVNALRAVSFDFKSGQIPDQGVNGGGKESTGFIAEEVALIDPMLVIYTDNYTPEDLLFDQINYPNAILHKDGRTLIPQSVDYARVSVLLTGAIQDINTRLVNYASSTDLLISTLNISTVNNTITVGSSSNPYDLVVTGNIILNQNNLVNKLSFATSTLFESGVEGFAGARAFTFNATGFTNTVADNYILSLRANNNSVFSVAANGDVHALGNYYGASAVLGTSTNPGDLAERVDIAIDDTAEAGDVMMVDKDAPDTYRRSSSAYEQSVAGVISTNPTIIVGNGRTAYTAVLAMVGRVPIKVSDENGAISRGDLLVSASRLGYAMKYDPAKDKNNKVVGIIGMALEPLPASSSGKILALIRTGWVYNRDEDIKKLKNNIEQVAVSQGIDLNVASNPDNLNVVNNNNNQLVYSGGNLNLQNNSLINVASIIGKDNKWRIDDLGNLVQRITTASGDKEIYGLQSTVQREIVISGTSTLENGSKRVMLTDLDQAIIDRSVPLKIMITPSGETFGVYVAERSYDSFLVRENGNGISNAEFDWTVIAKVLVPEETVLPLPIAEPSSTTETPPAGNGGGQEVAPVSSEPATSSLPANTDPLPPTVAPDPVAPAPALAEPVINPAPVVEPAPVVVPDPVVAEPPQIVPAVPAP